MSANKTNKSNHTEPHQVVPPKPSISNIKKWFITGLLVALPIIVTFYIILWIVNFFDNLIVGTLFPNSAIAHIPGFGLVISVTFMVIIGFIASNYLGKLFISLGEYVVDRIPIVRTLYSTTKQIFVTIFSDNSRAFKDVVLVEYPRKGIWVMAFVTSDNSGEVGAILKQEMLNVFLPTTPNPTSGFLLFVPKKDVIVLNMKTDAAMKLIISGGVINPTVDKSTYTSNSSVNLTQVKHLNTNELEIIYEDKNLPIKTEFSGEIIEVPAEKTHKPTVKNIK
ncbi:DUF502 domain-containing protein [Candidatus Hepatincolaceae symbiont of Richtersius coronifer]